MSTNCITDTFVKSKQLSTYFVKLCEVINALYIILINKRIKDVLRVLLFGQKLRLIFRLCKHPVVMSQWLAFIENEPLAYRDNLSGFYRRLQKPVRPYLNNTYTASQRLAALLAHFEYLKRIFNHQQAPFVAIKTDGLQLAVFHCKKNIAYELILAETEHFEREGEFRLSIRTTTDHIQIAVIAFSLCGKPEPTLYIGCLQGHAAEFDQDFVRAITRNFYGIRPKNLLMFALYNLSEQWSIKTIKAIDNKQAVFAKLPGLFKNHNYIHADYEQFWLELGGSRQKDGWFLLPEQLHQRSVEDVPSKRRSEHRRKLEIRATIQYQIRDALNNQMS